MSRINEKKRSWEKTFKAWLHPRVVTMLFLGFSAGLPISLIFGTLSLWLAEAGVSKSAVTFFSWAALGYSFKFVWAPIIDKMPLPFLTRNLGRRRAWLLVAQILIIVAIVRMACVNPISEEYSLSLMALAAVFLGFSSATQDIVIDAYRIECVEESLQALLSSMYIAGYRIAMLVAGAGALFLASYLGSTNTFYNYGAWRMTYLVMASFMMIGVVTTLVIPEPEGNVSKGYEYSARQYCRFFALFILAAATFIMTFFVTASPFAAVKTKLLSEYTALSSLGTFLLETFRLVFALCAAGGAAWFGVRLRIVDKQMAKDTYVAPVKDFFTRYGGRTALLLLTLIGFYRLSDIVLGVMANVFYHDMGFSKNVIASITKGYGLVMTILGGFLGGVLTLRYNVYPILFLGALLSAATNLLFMLLAQSGTNVTVLSLVIAVDNLSAGLAATAFVAFLSSLTSISFTAVQYALFSSMMTLFPKLLGGYSGSIVTAWGYESFFLFTAVMGIPVLFLVWAAGSVVERQQYNE